MSLIFWVTLIWGIPASATTVFFFAYHQPHLWTDPSSEMPADLVRGYVRWAPFFLSVVVGALMLGAPGPAWLLPAFVFAVYCSGRAGGEFGLRLRGRRERQNPDL